jgi:outer membrane protein assembly factor BamD
LILALYGACSYKFTSVNDQSISDCAPREILEASEDAFSVGYYDRAAHLAEYIIEEHPDSDEAEDALYFAAESFFRLEEFKDAFNLLKELIVRFPASRYSRIVAERDFAIGLAFFEEGTGFFGWTKNRGFGIRVMTHLLTYFPTSDLADDAQFAMAEYYFSKVDFFASSEAFERVVTEYPTSEWAERATFMAALSYFNINKGPDYDRESLLQCIQILRHYAARYPRGSSLKECGEILAEACERMAQKEMEVADYYFDQEKEFGARIHLANIVLLFPDTSAGAEAKRMLDERGWDTAVNSIDAIRPRKVFQAARR